jgi:hypothetical protein
MKNISKKMWIIAISALIACTAFATPVGATVQVPQITPINMLTISNHNPKRLEFIGDAIQVTRAKVNVFFRQLVVHAAFNSSGGHRQMLGMLTEDALD